MKVVAVIPSRYASTRFPGKPLAPILGRPLLQWVVEGLKGSQSMSSLIVATDHPEIFALAESLAVEAVMTDSNLASGSDRVWAAVAQRDFDVVVNVQGDEPLFQGWALDQLVEPFLSDRDLPMATLARPLQADELESRDVVKVLVNQKSEAIYFSRYPIPYSRQSFADWPEACFKHIGVYAFRKDFLKTFCAQPPVPIERGESLEQLRALWLGGRIRVVLTELDSLGVDRPEDVEKVERLMQKQR